METEWKVRKRDQESQKENQSNIEYIRFMETSKMTWSNNKKTRDKRKRHKR